MEKIKNVGEPCLHFLKWWYSVRGVIAFILDIFSSTGFYGEALSIILSLILIEGLLSVDNALGIAAMASHLPKDQQKKALRWGIIGAYLFRGIALAAVAWLMDNMWLKWIGAGYLVYLAANHLAHHHHEDHHEEALAKQVAKKGLLATICSIELMDLSLSLDNVIAAVSVVNGAKHIPVEYHIWVVCVGVFIGILALRIVAGWCIGIIQKHPILNHTAFLLIGFVGMQLMIDMGVEATGNQLPSWAEGPIFKFVVITIIVVLSLIYSKNDGLRAVLHIPVLLFRKTCTIIADTVHCILWPIIKPFQLLLARVDTKEPQDESQQNSN